MNLTAFAIEKKTLTYFAVFLFAVAGLAAFFSLGQLEDPAFTVKTAMIATPYPGASPGEVELEVTDRIELAIQEMGEVYYIESDSRAGLSLVKVEIKSEYWSKKLPQIWDMLRRKIRDIESTLPSGAGRPVINDDFGDVYGFQLALMGDGFDYAEMEKYAKDIKKELSLVKGVARVELWGVQQKVIYLDVSESQLAALALSDESIVQTLQQQNMVVDSGKLDLQTKRFRIASTGEFQSPEDIGNLTIRPSVMDLAQMKSGGSGESRSELIRIRDIGTIRRGYQEPATNLMRYDGHPALVISLTNIPGVNIVDVGNAIDKRLDELIGGLPMGIEVSRFHWQSDIVSEAVNGFLISFMEAVAIVLVILAIFMGVRLGLIIGGALVLTILASFLVMALLGIDLQRMSLGALIIALGMMVDNAIVVADGIVIRVQSGKDRIKAAIESAKQPAMPLLGATIIAVMAFYPIYSSTEGAGEYCRTLFTVVAISLMLSWVISMTVTPLQCIDLLPGSKAGEAAKDPYGDKFYQMFRKVLGMAIRRRWATMGFMVLLLVIAGLGFGKTDKLFFPDSSMTKFMIDYWAPEGTRIEQVSEDLKRAEKKILGDKRVANVATFIGSGPPRFYLPVEPERAYSSYAQFIVNVHDFKEIDDVITDLRDWFQENYPDSLVPLRKYGVGPSKTWKFDLRIIGPGDADPDILRSLAGEVTGILDKSPLCAYARTDWRQRVQKVVPEFNEERARWASVTREDIARATKRAFDGRRVGMYREGDSMIPIIMRHTEKERTNINNMDTLQVRPALSTKSVPLSQVTDGIDTEWEDAMIWRRDRRRTIKVQANPVPGVTLPALRSSVLEEIEKIKLPGGYTMEWGGEHEDSLKAKQSLVPGVIPAVVIVAFILVALFNTFRPPMIIVATIPFAAIGITAGLLLFNTPFGFLALLGAMSLAGMMIKNAIVLLDQVNLNLSDGYAPYDAVVEAAVSRLRPVALAAATTVLGVIPLLQDVFWIGLAVTVMAGLTFGTILTMIVVPVLYAIFFNIREPEHQKIVKG